MQLQNSINGLQKTKKVLQNTVMQLQNSINGLQKTKKVLQKGKKDF